MSNTDGRMLRFGCDLVFEVDESCRYVSVSGERLELLSVPPGQMLGRRVQEVVVGDLGRCFEEGIARVFATGQPEHWEFLLEGPMGLRHFTSTTLKLPGGTARVQVLVQDVSDQRELEPKLIQADRLTSLGILAAGVGHEINNPLAVVVANLYLVQRGLEAGPATARLTQPLQDALEAASRIQGIVADLRSFNPRKAEELGPVDVRQALESAVSMAMGEIRHRAVLQTRFEGTPPVDADKAQLGQVFLNLLINAAHAIEPGHQQINAIHIATRTDARGWAVIEVSDTGKGVAPEHRRRIFDPFFSTKDQGMGLGLAISHRIVTGFGGSIALLDRPGPGAAFEVALPPSENASAHRATGAARQPAPPLPRLRMLLVEDRPSLLRALQLSLSEDYDVVTAISAEEALQRISEDPALDIVLCDLMMPDATGMDLYESLPLVRPGLQDRVIFMTGGAFTPSAREFLGRVPNPSIEKPFTPDTLRPLVQRLWKQHGR